MAIDTPATIGIIGAGPVGLEAALYARFLGYQVLLLDQGGVADHVRQWGHVRMFSPFGMNRTPLALAALDAQGDGYQPPGDDQLLTGSEWIERYLQPLADSDLLADCLRLHSRVVAVTRQETWKGDAVGQSERGEDSFRLLYVDPQGEEQEAAADVVIDAGGVFSQPNWLGRGGAPAIGERAAAERIWRGLPDVLGADREAFAGRRTLVAGGGYSAATTIASLGKLSGEAPHTQVVWLTRHADRRPLHRIPEDRLPARDEVVAAALRCQQEGLVQWLPGVFVEEMRRTEDGRLAIRLSNETTETVDQVVSHTGFHVNNSLYQELQVHQCYATDGPMGLASALMKSDAGRGDCLDPAAGGAESLRTTEPNFYLLGAKSYGRNSQFLVQRGYDQIRELFSVLGGRESLDLYSTIALPGADH